MIFLFSDLKFSWWPVRSSLLDLTGKKSNSVIAVTRDKVIVFSVGVGGEICGDDLVNITGTGENWGGETSWRWYTQCDKHVFLLSPCPSGAVVQLVDGSLLHLVLKDDQASLQPTLSSFQPFALLSYGLSIVYLDNKELASNITSLQSEAIGCWW